MGIVIVPEHRWWVAESMWRGAEEYGFDHAWTYDHLGSPALVDGPWFAAVPTLTAAAMVTSRIRLGTFVASPNFRHPVPFARELLALDDISDGRFVLGVGAGGLDGHDGALLGAEELSRQERAARFDEFVELLDGLLTGDDTTWRGEYYAAVAAHSAPGCVQRPRLPFVVAATGARTMRVAATFGQGWLTTGADRDSERTWWQSVAELRARFADAVAATGRPPSAVATYLSLDGGPVYSLSSIECFRDAVGRAAELGFTDVVAHWPRADGEHAGAESVLEDVAAQVLPTLDTTRSGGHS